MENTKKTTVGCAVYLRPDRSGKQTTDKKLMDCRSKASRQGWTIATQHIFRDEHPDSMLALQIRPGFSALMEAATKEQRPFDYVIVDASDTLSRTNSEVLKAFRELALRGIVLVAANARTVTDG
jgi:DNA invertase Pin-like site-specific DNA recombinase